MKASNQFIKALENEGVNYVFAVPGEENLDLLESIRNSKLKLIVTRHEQSAGFMAATIGRLTGQPGVALSTLGPGATNFTTAVAYATLGGMPALFITGQKPVKHSKQGHFQIVDTIEIMQPITKLSRRIGYADRIPSTIREAFRTAAKERPGAVVLELPEDVAADQTASGQILPISSARRPLAETKSLDLAASAISQAKRPLLLVGAGANRKRTSKTLTQFVDKLSIPFVTTQMGKGVIDERHPCYLGTAALSDHDFVHQAINHADLIINVGHDVIEKPPFIMKPSHCQVIHLNFSSARVDDVYFPQIEVVGDIANSIWQLTNRLSPQPHWNFSFYQKVRRAFIAHTQSLLSKPHQSLDPLFLTHTLRGLLPDEAIVALDNGVYKLFFARNYPAYQPNTLLLDNALATMGAGLPSAIAAKLVFPDRPVVALVGDGGFMMNSQELETAVRLNLNLTIILLNDNAYGMIKWKQTSLGFPTFGLDYQNPDFLLYAQSYCVSAHRINSPANLRPTLKKALQEPGISLVEVPIDYSQNVALLTHEIKTEAAKLSHAI